LKIDRTASDLVAPETIDLANRFLGYESTNFSDQVAFLKIDPTRELRHADLSFADFTGSDLSGFDFTGANLHGVTGVDVKWDNTTNFHDADVSNSVFAYPLTKQKFFSENPEHAERVERLKNEHWANAILMVEAMLRADVKTRSGDALKIARAVFDETRSLTVRSEILLYMGLGVETKEEHKAFIYNTLRNFSNEPSILRSCLRALRSLYANDKDAFNLMARYVEHADEKVSQEAAVGVLYSQHFSSASDSVKDMLVSAGSALARRAYVGRIAKAEFKNFAEILLDDALSNYVDFAELISNSKLEKMARKSLQNSRLRGISAKEVVAPLVDRDARVHADSDDPARRAMMIKTLLQAIGRKYRIPFRLEDQPIRNLADPHKIAAASA
jgi:uncharacterized protein YjbI with pentapeptide repeats